MEKKKHEVIAILPTLNEEKSLKKTAENILDAIPLVTIVVVDNGSTDLTVQIAKDLDLTILFEPQKGKGFAIRKGFSATYSNADAIFMVDGDDTYGLENLATAIDMVVSGGYDMVVGTRVASEVTKGRRPIYKRGHSLGNKALSSLSRSLHQSGINDSLSGWRVFSPGFVRSFPGGASGFEIEAELNAHAYLISAAIANVEVQYRGREAGSHSKLNTYKDGFRILRMNLRLFRNNRPLFAFSLFATPWALISAYLVGRSVNEFIKTGLVPKFPSLVAGVGAFIVSGLLWVTGMILQRIKLLRANIARYAYNSK